MELVDSVPFLSVLSTWCPPHLSLVLPYGESEEPSSTCSAVTALRADLCPLPLEGMGCTGGG